MRLNLRHELAFATVTLVHRGVSMVVRDVLVDTGAASTVVNADVVAEAGLVPEAGDVLRTLRGVGHPLRARDGARHLTHQSATRVWKRQPSDAWRTRPPALSPMPGATAPRYDAPT
jgi:hypothetical protein